MTSVDVVVAARDEERHLPACLRSIRSQTDVSLRLIIVDDGSTDATADIADAAAGEDPRVTVVHHDEAGGLAAARNAGLAVSTSPWITFVDGDDFLFPGALAARLRRLAEADGDVVGTYGDWISVPEWTPRLRVRRRAADRPDIWFLRADKAVPFIASAPVLDRGLVAALGGFDERCRTAEDAEFWQWWLRLAGRTVYTRHLCVGYRRRAGSMTRADLHGHFRGNREAAASFDDRLPDEAPDSLLTEPDAHYRTHAAHTGRGLLAALMAITDGSDATAIIDELDPVVLRLDGSDRLVDDAVRLARRRVGGTRGGRDAGAAIDRAVAQLRRLVEARAAAVPDRAALLDGARWLRDRRALPD